MISVSVMRKSKVFQTQGANRTVKDVRDERDYGHATLLSHRGKHQTVQMRWGGLLNKHAQEDQLFELQIGPEKALLSWEEIQRYGRWI